MLMTVTICFVISCSQVAISSVQITRFGREPQYHHHQTIFGQGAASSNTLETNIQHLTEKHPPVTRFGRVFRPSKVIFRNRKNQFRKDPKEEKFMHFSPDGSLKRFIYEKFISKRRPWMLKNGVWDYQIRNQKKTAERPGISS